MNSGCWRSTRHVLGTMQRFQQAAQPECAETRRGAVIVSLWRSHRCRRRG